MRLSTIIEPSRVACGGDMASKKRALEKLSDLIASGREDLTQTEIFDCLLARERLGSTGLGKGIAIPHGRMKKGSHVIAAFLKLNKGIDYDAPDGQPVDLFCALLVPPESTDEHLEILATLTEMFSQPEIRQQIRGAKTGAEIYELITHWSDQEAHESPK